MSYSLRRRDALHRWEGRFGPNMTPMVDIVLVILIFFMAGTTILGQEWFLRSEVLKRGAGPKPPDPLELPPVWLTISMKVDDRGTTIVAGMGDALLTLDEFDRRLREFTEGTDQDQIVVVLTPSAEVPYKDVVRAHESCARAGVKRVGIGTGGG
jgi:biopolymer transport protein ExbD